MAHWRRKNTEKYSSNNKATLIPLILLPVILCFSYFLPLISTLYFSIHSLFVVLLIVKKISYFRATILFSLPFLKNWMKGSFNSVAFYNFQKFHTYDFMSFHSNPFPPSPMLPVLFTLSPLETPSLVSTFVSLILFCFTD